MLFSSRRQRVAVIGAGNLGRYLAAHLADGGHDVFFCVRRPPAPMEVAGLGHQKIPYCLHSPPPADVVLFTVKAYDTRAALAWLPALCTGGQPVAVIQNGVHHTSRVAPYPVVPVLAYVYVEEINGILHGFAPPRPHLTVPTASILPSLFADTAIQVQEEPAFHTAAWRKMLHNCASNPLTALAGRGLEIFSEPLYFEWATGILAEALPIANADGASLAIYEPEDILRILKAYPAGTRTSMLLDRERGRPLELSILTGALVELGQLYGLPTPVNEDLLTRLAYPERTCPAGSFSSES